MGCVPLLKLSQLSRIEQQGGSFGSTFVPTKYSGEIPGPRQPHDGDKKRHPQIEIALFQNSLLTCHLFQFVKCWQIFPGVKL